MVDDNNVNLNEVINNYAKHWKWFILSVIIAITIAFVYLRYAIPEYDAKAKVQILKNQNSSELSALQDLDIFSGGNNTEIKDEIEILNARSNHIGVVKKLKLNIKYFVIGSIKNSELYGEENFPFNINFLASDSIVSNSKFSFFINLKSKTHFGYSLEEEENYKNYDFGSNITTEIGDIILIPKNNVLNQYYNQKIQVNINPVVDVAGGFRFKIFVEPSNEDSNIVDLSLIDPIKQRAIDYLNELIRINNANAVEDKKEVADRTEKFINDRIKEIYGNLSNADETAENFKASRGIANLGVQSSVNFDQSAAGEQQLQQANINLSIAGSMQSMLENQEGFEIIPAVGLSDQNIDDSAARYNELVAQRNRLLKSSNAKNPVIVKLDQQLAGLKQGIQSSLNNVTNNLNLQVNSLSKQLSQINSRIYAAPSNERVLRDISRKQQTTESLYLYLLQKREEAQITYASAQAKSKVIDAAYGTKAPVTPKVKLTYIAYFLLGLLIPFGIIYVYYLLDNKVHNKIGLEKFINSKHPVLAELPILGKKEKKLVNRIDRSVFGESLRILRTNLDYLLRSSESSKKGKVILVTSSIPGEGKTLLSSNLAMIFASTRKKVLLLGADIRNPKLYDFYDDLKGDSNNNKRKVFNGLTEYLYDENIGFKDILKPINVNDNALDVIYSGEIPLNPSELLMSKRFKVLIENAKEKYDYIIIDSAPLLVVTDTLLISNHADQIIYVTRAGATEEKVIDYPLKLAEEGKLKNLSFIVNGVKNANLGYGKKYGYGYGVEKKKWWKFLSK